MNVLCMQTGHRLESSPVLPDSCQVLPNLLPHTYTDTRGATGQRQATFGPVLAVCRRRAGKGPWGGMQTRPRRLPPSVAKPVLRHPYRHPRGDWAAPDHIWRSTCDLASATDMRQKGHRLEPSPFLPEYTQAHRHTSYHIT